MPVPFAVRTRIKRSCGHVTVLVLPDESVEHPPAHGLPFNCFTKPIHSASQDPPEHRVEARFHPSVVAQARADGSFKKYLLDTVLRMAPLHFRVELAPNYEELTDADVQRGLDR